MEYELWKQRCKEPDLSRFSDEFLKGLIHNLRKTESTRFIMRTNFGVISSHLKKPDYILFQEHVPTEIHVRGDTHEVSHSKFLVGINWIGPFETSKVLAYWVSRNPEQNIVCRLCGHNFEEIGDYDQLYHYSAILKGKLDTHIHVCSNCVVEKKLPIVNLDTLIE